MLSYKPYVACKNDTESLGWTIMPYIITRIILDNEWVAAAISNGWYLHWTFLSKHKDIIIACN